MLWLSRLDQVDPAGPVKVFVRRNVELARTVTLSSQKGEPAARRVTLLAKRTVFSHLHGSPRFFNRLNHKKSTLDSLKGVSKVFRRTPLLVVCVSAVQKERGLWSSLRCWVPLK